MRLKCFSMAGDANSSAMRITVSPAKSAMMPARGLIDGRTGRDWMLPGLSELEVDEGICLIRSQEGDYKCACQSEGHTRLDSRGFKAVLVSRPLQIKIHEHEWKGEDGKKENCSRELWSPTPTGKSLQHLPRRP